VLGEGGGMAVDLEGLGLGSVVAGEHAAAASPRASRTANDRA
jgi:hypothetical protein